MVTVFGTFDHDTGIQIMLNSEFGLMFEKMSNVEEIFTTMLAELDLTHARFEAMPPYAALMDKTAWQVTKTELTTQLCDHKGICIQHLVVEHVDFRASLRIFNAHIPTSVATWARKEAIAKKLCRTATSTHGSGVAQPTAAQHATPLPWAIVRDLNVDVGTMIKWCQPFLKKCAVPVYISMASHARSTPSRCSIFSRRHSHRSPIMDWMAFSAMCVRYT